MADSLCAGSACGQPMHVLHVFLPVTVFTLPATERLEFVTKVLHFGLEHPHCPAAFLSSASLALGSYSLGLSHLSGMGSESLCTGVHAKLIFMLLFRC